MPVGVHSECTCGDSERLVEVSLYMAGFSITRICFHSVQDFMSIVLPKRFRNEVLTKLPILGDFLYAWVVVNLSSGNPFLDCCRPLPIMTIRKMFTMKPTLAEKASFRIIFSIPAYLFMLFLDTQLVSAQTCTIATDSVTGIANTQAVCGGNTGLTVPLPGGSTFQCNGNSSRGVCWSTSPSPTTSLTTKKSLPAGNGTFSTTITGLTPGATYYVRAFAVNQLVGPTGTSMSVTAYGNEVSFKTTGYTHPINTSAVSSVTSSTASAGGTFVPGTISSILSKGIVWSTTPSPTVSLATKTTNGFSISSFTATMTKLKSATKYYVRAYVTTRSGTLYGNELSFTTANLQDVDGNTYQTVQIGNQVWMKENLKTSKYRDGTAIATGLSNAAWSSTNTGAYALYDNVAANNASYGKLYNAYAVTNAKGICPAGYHVPSDTELDQLMNHLGSVSATIPALTTFFGGNNSTAFSMQWGGYKSTSGLCGSVNQLCFFWTSTPNPANPTTHQNSRGYDGSTRSKEPLSTHVKSFGFSVRCVVD